MCVVCVWEGLGGGGGGSLVSFALLQCMLHLNPLPVFNDFNQVIK